MRTIIIMKEMEDQLADYIARASDIYYGISPKELRKLAIDWTMYNGACLISERTRN